MAKKVKVPVSTARARLFELADLVRRSGDEVTVVLEQRGEREGVALVREARLAYLEERVAQIDRQAGAFSLAGSLSTELDDEALETAMREIRKGWAAAPTAGPARSRRRRA
jgi:hypothetical protein